MILQISEYVKENYIKTRYFAQEGIWQLLQPKHFVNVLLIHHMKQHSEKELIDVAALMREGLTHGTHRISNSDKKKHEIDSLVKTHNISDIFIPLQKPDGTTVTPDVMVIDGAPGMGKTTLSKEIAYQWAKGQLLNDKSIIFFIYLRDPEIRQIYDLRSFIHYFYNFDEAAAEFCKQYADVLIKRNNKDITIILDGYDEYFDMSGKLFITRILNRKVFTQSKLVITSRPIATDKLQHIADIRVEVMGFTDSSKQEYIIEELKYSPNKMKKLLLYLDENKTINSICYIPMIMTILVCTFKEIEEFPTDQTELYERFITLAICRYVQKLENNPTSEVYPLQHLPESYYQYIIELSKFAFDSLKEDKIVFTEEDIETLCPNLALANKNFQGLGLLKSAQYFSMKRIEKCYSYNFLHLSIQEFLSAYYINSLEVSYQFKLLKSTFFIEKYTNTWTLFGGLNKTKMLEFFAYLIYGMPCKEMKHKTMPKIVNLDPIQAFIQTVKICTDGSYFTHCKLFCYKNSEIELYNDGVPQSFIFLRKEISIKVNWYKVYLSLCSARNGGNQSLETFVIDKSKQEGVYAKLHLQLSENTHLSVVIINAVSMVAYRATKQQIIDGFDMNDSIDCIEMTQCAIDKETAEKMSLYFCKSRMTCALFDGCTFNNGGDKIILNGLSSINTLQVLFIDNTNVDETTAIALASVIENNSKLHLVKLFNCNLQKNASIIATALKNISTVSALYLSQNKISGSVTDDLAIAIIVNCNMKTLYLSDNNLQHHGVVIASALSQIKMLVELDLSNNSMTENVVDELSLAIENNKSLQVLRIGGNKLMTDGIIKICRSISSISNLQILGINDNQITERAADAIAHAISSNTRLEQLHLDSNKLHTGISKIATALTAICSLKVLDLDDNEISTAVTSKLAHAIMSNSSLEELRLRNNKLTTSGIITIAQALSNISTLKILDVYNNQITEDAAEALSLVLLCNTGIEQLYLGDNNLQHQGADVASALCQIKTLVKLDLNNNNMTEKVADDLSLAIENNKSLQVLRIGGNKLRTDGIIKISRSISSLSSLQVLQINDNQITERAADAIAHAISRNCGLQQLCLGSNKICTGAMKIAIALTNVSSLKLLDLSDNEIPAVAASTIASVIMRNSSLEDLRLRNNKLTTSGIITIAQALSNISTLKILDVYNNQITEDAAEALSLVLLCNTGIEQLYLGDNNLQHQGADVASALCQIKTLVKLDLNNNNMTEKVADDLSLAIENNKSLQVLRIGGNKLRTDGIIKISRSISSLSSLQVLQINDNQITERAADAIAHAISRNCGLQQLCLGSNKICTGAMKIAIALTNVSSLKLLDLSDNEIPAVAASTIASVIMRNSSLEDLRLRNNKLMTDGIITIAQSLCYISTLKILDINTNQITDEAVDVLSKVISSNTGIEHLCLGDNNFQAGIMKVLKVLKTVRMLQTLDINDNNIPYKVFDETTNLAHTSKYHASHLKSGGNIVEALCLNTNVKSRSFNDISIKQNKVSVIADVISSNTSLQNLWLKGNNLNSDKIIMIAKSLSNLTSLNRFDLRSNQITEKAVDAINSLILRNDTLQELYLGDNDLRAGVLTIVASLQNVSTLRNLTLDNNSIPDKMCVNLVNFITNVNLELLDLSFNCLQLSGKFVVQGLSKINTLTSLYLSNCYMTDKAANSLATAIKSNCSLKALFLRNNNLQTNGVVTICQSLKCLSSLQEFNISCNEITEQSSYAIASVISSNTNMNQFFLGDNKLHNSALIIMRALQTISSVVILYLSYMEMTDDSAADLAETINNNPLLEHLYVAGNSLSSSLINVIKACKKSVKRLLTLDLRYNLVDPSKISDMASIIGRIGTLEALFIGGLVISNTEKFFNNFLFKFEKLHPHSNNAFDVQSNAFDMNLIKEYEVLELLNSESQRENTCNCIKFNYYSPTGYLLFKHAEPMNGPFNGHLIDKYDYLTIKLQRTEQILSQVNATSIIYLLPVISKLKVLDMERSNVDEVAAFELGAILSCNNVLEQLWLSGNQLGITGAMFILNSLEHMSTLAVLDLSFNYISCHSADGVASVIKCNSKLEQLWLDGNGLLDVGVKQICHALQCVTNLRILSLCSNGITDDAAEELSDAISTNNLLGDLSLGNNKLQSVGICKIAHHLNNQLIKLDLFHNGASKTAAEKLAVTISKCYTLQTLYLSDNMLETEGAIKIFESLKHKSKLQVLTLSNNNITDEAIDELCLVLAQNPRLQVLLLGGNKLQTAGVVRIARVVKCENLVMRLLVLCENNVSKQGKEEVERMFSENKHIHVNI